MEFSYKLFRDKGIFQSYFKQQKQKNKNATTFLFTTNYTTFVQANP